MIQNFIYQTPAGFSNIMVGIDGDWLVGLRFTEKAPTDTPEQFDTPIADETRRWLDMYFGGDIPNWIPKHKLNGITPFRRATIDALKQIPFGTTISYKEIANKVSRKIGVSRVSARAVGGAIGWNPICIIIPCHRVIGAQGEITGYNGGIKNKIALLRHEGVRID